MKGAAEKLINSGSAEDAQGMNYPQLLTLKGAAKYLGVTPWKMRSLVWGGFLRPFPMPRSWRKGCGSGKGRQIYLRRIDLEAFLNGGGLNEEEI